jgi:hypothetical protein
VTTLVKIINLHAVKGVLLEHSSSLTLDPPIPTEKLVKFFSETAVKVFAILAHRDRLDLVEHFYQNGFQDRMLPVQSKTPGSANEDLILGPYNRSGGDDDDDDEKVRNPFTWRGNNPQGPKKLTKRDVNDFYETWQWPFTPPVFVHDQFVYEFRVEMRLPFTRSAGPMKNSDFLLYSEVKEKSVHTDHPPKNPVSVTAFSYSLLKLSLN